MYRKSPGLVITIVAALASAPAAAFEALNDAQLETVTAGSASADIETKEMLTRIPFRHQSKKHRVDGEVIVLPTYSSTTTGNLQLMDHAQSNLRSLININAVNSPVQVLLNLNISIDSRIDNLHQWNALMSD